MDWMRTIQLVERVFESMEMPLFCGHDDSDGDEEEEEQVSPVRKRSEIWLPTGQSRVPVIELEYRSAMFSQSLS